MIQDVPSPAAYYPDLHKINLKGKADMNWVFMHRDHIAQWDMRAQHIFVGDVGIGVSARYPKWYSSITYRYLTRIGGGHSFTVITNLSIFLLFAIYVHSSFLISNIECRYLIVNCIY